MAPTINETTRNEINRFNETYGVKFDINEYFTKAKRTSPNEALKEMFTDMYKKVMLHDLAHGTNVSCKMIENYDSSIIYHLKDNFRNSDREFLPHKNAGMDKIDRYNLLNGIWKDMPKSDTDVIKESYEKGDIRIRDMMAVVNQLKHTEATRDEQVRLASFSEALKKVNESRSFVWRVFHPIRNSAEKRYAARIEEFINDRSNNKYKYVSRDANQKVSKMETLKFNTTLYTLGVSNPKNFDRYDKKNLIYSLDPDFEGERLSKLIEEVKAEEEAKRKAEEEAKKADEGKDPISVDALKEDPYKDSESNKKIDENVKSNPKLEK